MSSKKKTPRNKFKHRVIAIVYDFDGTLSPNNMQEDTILKTYRIDKKKFWDRANELVKKHGYERTLAYLKLLIYDRPFVKKPLTQKQMHHLAHQLEYFPGVTNGYFDELRDFMKTIPEVKEWDIKLEHYIISSGLKDILEGSAIRKHFKKMYACEYEYKNGKPIFPKLVINDTNKTQFLFRINKGKLELSQGINEHTPEEDRRIPFKNMIYVGDGITDVPSMTVTHKQGGYAIAVYDPKKNVPDSVLDMVSEKRAQHFAAADFRSNSLLVKILHRTLKKIIHSISYEASSEMSLKWVSKNAN